MRRLHATTWVALVCAWGAGLAVAAHPISNGGAARPAAPLSDGLWRTAGGKVTLLFASDRMRELGFELQTLTKTAISDVLPEVDGTFAIQSGASSGILFASRNGRFSALAGGGLPTDGEMLFVLANGDVFHIGDFDFHVSLDANGAAVGSVTDRRDTDREVFRFSGGLIQFDAPTGRFEWGGGELALDSGWAHEVGLDAAGGEIVGTLLVEADARPATDATPSGSGSDGTPPGEEDASNDAYGLAGPDVIVGDLSDLSRYGVVSGITAFSVGTVSCNIGTQPVGWHSSTNQHPVIAQNMYRLKNGRMEQIGMSWLKHGFAALSGNLCFSDCQGTGGTTLGVHCSDPYGSGLNGSQSNLGPHWQVNAATGFFPYPPANPSTPATVGRRLQVHNTDLDPGQNAGALYFVEGHYVAPDDAAANNKNNNASYRRITVSGTPGSGTYNIAMTSTTQRQKSALLAWKDNDSAVTINNVDVANDGRFSLAYKVTDIGGGTFHYEWALYNMNSDRSGQSFSIPVTAGVTLSNVGFHDVDYHSGDGNSSVTFDGTDWTFSQAGGLATWSTQTVTQNANANALRWGTTYNFRFDANAPPQAGNSTIGLFRAGSPGSITIATQVPTGGPCTDTNPPVITCPGNMTQEATSAAGANVNFTVTATDDCTSSPSIVSAPASGSPFAMGTTTVNSTATDGASRTASCSFTVTVRDTTPPTLTCPANMTRECTSTTGATVSYTVTATDLVDPNPTLSCNPPSGSFFPFGTTGVNCSSSDHATPPNTRTCSFNVTVRDATAPTITCPGNITTDCSQNGGVVTFSVTATDACDTTPTVTCLPPSGTAFSAGTTSVTCTARDDANNAGTCSFNVTVTEANTCLLGTVNAAVGSPVNVFSINGSVGSACDRRVTVAIDQPLSLHMDSAPSGNTDRSYILWVWRGLPQGSHNLVIGGNTIGCTGNPTPFNSSLSPQPIRCVRGGLGSQYCGSVREVSGSPTTPWTITRSQGLRRAGIFTLQGGIADFNSATAAAMSVTNGIVLDIH